MATIMDYVICKQCGFEFGHEEFNCHTDEWNYGLRSTQDVEEAAGSIQESIAKGELDAGSSYVTRWDADAKRAEVGAGKGLEP
jgi:hypothetical protein